MAGIPGAERRRRWAQRRGSHGDHLAALDAHGLRRCPELRFRRSSAAAAANILRTSIGRYGGGSVVQSGGRSYARQQASYRRGGENAGGFDVEAHGGRENGSAAGLGIRRRRKRRAGGENVAGSIRLLWSPPRLQLMARSTERLRRRGSWTRPSAARERPVSATFYGSGGPRRRSVELPTRGGGARGREVVQWLRGARGRRGRPYPSVPPALSPWQPAAGAARSGAAPWRARHGGREQVGRR